MNEELISVIMCVYNENKVWLKQSIQSIINQTHLNIEFVIVIDTTDNNIVLEVEKLTKDYDFVRLIKNAQNLGFVKSLNIALENITGEYVARMDADDISKFDRLEKQINYLKEYELDFVFSEVNLINEDGNIIKEKKCKSLDHQTVKKLMSYGNISKHPTWLFRSEVYRELGGYREIYFAEDYDFSLRALEASFQIGRTSEVLLDYRYRESSISRLNALDQFLISKKINHFFNKGLLSITDSQIFNCTSISDVDRHKFILANKFYSDGVTEIQTKKFISGTKNILKSGLKSKYGIQKIYDVLKFKYIERTI